MGRKKIDKQTRKRVDALIHHYLPPPPFISYTGLRGEKVAVVSDTCSFE